jgi:hypothetical protein
MAKPSTAWNVKNTHSTHCASFKLYESVLAHVLSYVGDCVPASVSRAWLAAMMARTRDAHAKVRSMPSLEALWRSKFCPLYASLHVDKILAPTDLPTRLQSAMPRLRVLTYQTNEVYISPQFGYHLEKLELVWPSVYSCNKLIMSLASLPHLHTLSVMCSLSNLLLLQPLSACASLRILELAALFACHSTVLRQCPQIRVLRVIREAPAALAVRTLYAPGHTNIELQCTFHNPDDEMAAALVLVPCAVAVVADNSSVLCLPRIHHLRKLQIGEKRMDEQQAAFHAVANCTSLQSLSIHDGICNSSMSATWECTTVRLTSLLSHLLKLHTLELVNCELENLAFLEVVRNQLRHLSLSDYYLDGEACLDANELKHVATCVLLETLHTDTMFHNDPTPDQMRPFKIPSRALPRLHTVHIKQQSPF